jgi:hypothetical protein
MVEETWCHGPYYLLLVQQILGIVGFQIEIEKILVSILIKLRRYWLYWNSFEKLIFVSKNWPIDVKVNCKTPSNLIELVWCMIKKGIKGVGRL